jgi:hypothetical protein
MPVHVGSGVSIGHGAIVHGATIEDHVILGMGATVMNGARIGGESLIAANALVTEGKHVPSGVLFAGVPGRVVRKPSEQETSAIRNNAEKCHEMADTNASFLAARSDPTDDPSASRTANTANRNCSTRHDNRRQVGVCPTQQSSANVWLGVRTSSTCLYPSCISFGFVEQGAWLDAFLPQPEHVSCWRYYFNSAAANEPPLLANSYNLTGQAGPIFHIFTHHFVTHVPAIYWTVKGRGKLL